MKIEIKFVMKDGYNVGLDHYRIANELVDKVAAGSKVFARVLFENNERVGEVFVKEVCEHCEK